MEVCVLFHHLISPDLIVDKLLHHFPMRGCKFICNDSSLIANEVAGLAKHYAFYILQLLPIVLLYLVQLLGNLVLLLFLIADPTKTAINATGDD